MSKERMYCGKNYKEMNEILRTLCDMEDDILMSAEESTAMDIAIQCVATVTNRMTGRNKKINFD